MKISQKITRYFTIAFMSAMAILPIAASAQFEIGDFLPNLVTPFGPSEGLLGVVGTAITLAFGVAGLVAVIYLIIGGFNYVTAGGNPEAVEMAKTTIVNAIIGLLVILVSYLIVQFIMTQIGANPGLPEDTL
jgi:predicted secreted protein